MLPVAGGGSHAVATTEDRFSGAGLVVRALGSRIPRPAVWSLALVGTVLSAIAAKEMSVVQPPPAVSMVQIPDPAAAPADAKLEKIADAGDTDEAELAALNATMPVIEPVAMVAAADSTPAYLNDASTRWFNGRPARPAKKMWMIVTGYSPDSRSCGDSADGRTATLHSVSTNGGKLVAADTRILAYGSMLSIPGYDAENVVPVLDCGGAIKGHRLDLLFPTHEQALKWGRKKVLVTVWEYADGLGGENPRKLR
jgi:3D (Asp-Asp-Asp) domain-containing protein